MKAKRLVLALVALLLLGGCAEATATNEAPSAWATKEADSTFVRKAEGALAAAPAPQPGWRVGVILATKDDKDASWVASVLTPEGMVTVGPDEWSYDCEQKGKAVAYDTFPVILSPGDLITWAGDGRTVHHVCAEDMRVIRKAAA